MSNCEQLLTLAEYYFNKKNFTFSENFLKQAIKLCPSHSKANELLGYIHGNRGDFDLSYKYLELACLKDECTPEALYYLGSFQLKRHLFNEAINSFRKAINKADKFFEALHDLGVAYAHIGELQKSLSCYEDCLKIKKDSFELYFNIGRCLDDLNRFNNALTNYDEAIRLKPDYIEAWSNKGICLNELKRFDEALIHFNRALDIEPNYAEAWLNKAICLIELMRFDEALIHFDRALELNPNYAEACSNKGVCLIELMRFDEALIHFDRALQLKPDYAEAWSNKGTCLNKLMRFDEALNHFDRALQLKPDYAEAWSNKGLTLNDMRHYEEAFFCYDRAINCDHKYNKAYFNKSILSLRLKNFQEGWKNFEERLRSKRVEDFKLPVDAKDIPVWDGNSCCDHLLVLGEQGIGDEVFYIRVINQLYPRVKRVSVFVDERLLEIFSRSFPLVTFLSKNSKINVALYDAQIFLASLPRVLNIEPSRDQFIKSSYLVDHPVLTEKLKESNFFKNRFTCGISWQSSNKEIGKQKSIQLNELSAVLKTSNCQFINLQYGDTAKEVTDFEKVTGIKLNKIEDIDVFSDVDGLLSIIESCDMIITTSNITAHLAGAVGKKTLLLLPYSQGRIWYWHEESNSTWYPSIKQYFQDQDLGWSKAIKEITAELRGEIDRKN